MSQSIRIGANLAVEVTVQAAENGEFRAQVQSISTTSNPPHDVLRMLGTGFTPESALQELEGKLRYLFTVDFGKTDLRTILASLVTWAWRGSSTTSRVRRFSCLAAVAIAVSPFFVDFSSGDSTIARNIRTLVKTDTGNLRVSDSGYIGEQFVRDALQRAQHRVWLSGVSFRNLVQANRDALVGALARGVEIRIVLLDPATDSPLASDQFLPRISRTAKRQDISDTLEALCGPSGLITQSAAKDHAQVWLSDYAPIVPMAVVDDLVSASFLTHVSNDTLKNNYGGPFITVPSESSLGALLLSHFQAMLNHPSAKRRL